MLEEKKVECTRCATLNWPTAPSCTNCTAELVAPALGIRLRADECVSVRTFPQKVALFFMIADFVLLLPATYGLAVSLIFLGSAPWLTLLVAGWYTLGCALLAGFIKRLRNTLAPERVRLLWGGTIAYNMVELLCLLYAIGQGGGDSPITLFFLWPLLVVFLSGLALGRETYEEPPPFARRLIT